MSAISVANLPLSTTTSNPVTSLQTYFKERSPEVHQLEEALKSGDLAGAQQAYSNLVALGKNVLQKNNPFLRSDRAFDFNAIGGALQNGDLSGAQQAFASLQATFGRNLPPASSSVPSATGQPAAVVNLSNPSAAVSGISLNLNAAEAASASTLNLVG